MALTRSNLELIDNYCVIAEYEKIESSTYSINGVGK